MPGIILPGLLSFSSIHAAMSRPVTVNVLYRALKDSSADRKLLLVCLGLETAKIKEFERENQYNSDRVLVDSLDYFLKNCVEEGHEWESVIEALETNGDHKTAETIRKTYLPAKSIEDYCVFEFPAAEEERQKRKEYLEKMKVNTQTTYNAAEKKISDCHYDIHTALETEKEEASRMLGLCKQKVEKKHSDLESGIQELIERTTTQQKKLQEAINRLRRGDYTAVATLREAKKEMVELEKLAKSLDRGLERYKKYTLQSYDNDGGLTSTSTNVLQDLQSILIMNTDMCSSVEEDNYATINDSQ